MQCKMLVPHVSVDGALNIPSSELTIAVCVISLFECHKHVLALK